MTQVTAPEETQAHTAGGRFKDLMTAPLEGRLPRPMTQPGDYVVLAGIVLYAVSVFGLKWMTVGIRDVTGIGETLGIKGPRMSFGLFKSPWAWALVVLLALAVAGLWFVQARGWISVGAGVFCLVFNVIFFIGAWHKINAIIGDVVSFARGIPFIGQALGDVVGKLAKQYLSVHVSIGYWLFIPAGILLIAGGLMRMAGWPRSGRAKEAAS